jgi:hypothetical protein
MNYPISGNVSLGNVSGNIKLYINDAGTSNLTGIGYNNNSLTFGVNQSVTATPEMVINPSGNVGIGTTNPVYQLDIIGNIRLGAGTTGNIRFGNSGVGTTQAGYIDLINNNMTIMNHQPSNLILGTNNAERMRIIPTGNVGIGTTNPHLILDVSGGVGSKLHNLYINSQNGTMAIGAYPVYTSNSFGTGFALYQGVAGDTVLNAASGQAIDFKINNTNYMRVASSGNVGIGTSNPSKQLSLGTVNSSQKLALYDDGTGNNFYGFGAISNAIHFGAGTNNNANGQMVLTNNGLVCIGANNPQGVLDVRSSGQDTPTLFIKELVNRNQLRIFGNVTTGGWNNISQNNDVGIIYGDFSNPTPRSLVIAPHAVGPSGIRMDTNGNVGIGTSTPIATLDVKGAVTVRNSADSVFATLSTGNGNFLTIEAFNAENTIKYPVCLAPYGGNVGIRTTNTRATLHVNYNGGPNGMISESVLADSASARDTLLPALANNSILGPSPNSDRCYLYWKNASGTKYVWNAAGTVLFTGQHMVVPDNPEIQTNLTEYIGLIISSNDSGYTSYYNGIKYTGIDAIRICEALPNCKLSDKDNDKAVFGVITNQKNDEYFDTDGSPLYDNIDNGFEKSLYDRVRVNSVGEGSIWVTNINGSLENGDYITSSVIPGYGKRQNDDLLHNYTVAKTTMSCDFVLNSPNYKTKNIVWEGTTYIAAFIGCTYHCG